MLAAAAAVLGSRRRALALVAVEGDSRSPMQYEDSQESVLQCPASRQIAHCSQRPRCPGGADRVGGRSTVLSATIDMRIGHQLVESFIGEEQKLPCIAAKVGGHVQQAS